MIEEANIDSSTFGMADERCAVLPIEDAPMRVWCSEHTGLIRASVLNTIESGLMQSCERGE